MTVTIEDATYRRLQALAAARQLSVDAYLREIAGTGVMLESDSVRQLAALESIASGMIQCANGRLPPGHIADDSRESIYEGRGE